MLAKERYEKILVSLENDNFIKSSELVKMFGVSVETVRRDLEYLEKEGMLQRVHGGAVLDRINAKAVSFEEREHKNSEEKCEIARKALQFITEESVIALDNGTTTLEIAKLLPDNFDRLTVLTNSLLVVEALLDAPDFTVILLGGIVNTKEKSLKGPLVEAYIDMFHIDTAFISVSGISLAEGATEFDMDMIPIQKKMIGRSREKVLLADSSKFGVVSMLNVCDIKDVDCIITDSNLKDAVYDHYGQKGIKVIR